MVERWGPHRVLWLSALGIIPLPAFWVLSQSFAVLMVAQLLAGAVWAAYELATLLLFFETIPSQKRVGVLTVFNLANAGAVVVGSAIGGAMLALSSASRGAYLAVFAVSALARAAAVVTLVRVPRRRPPCRPLLLWPSWPTPCRRRSCGSRVPTWPPPCKDRTGGATTCPPRRGPARSVQHDWLPG